MKAVSLRQDLLNHIFGSTTIEKPAALWLKVYSADPGAQPTWESPVAIFAAYEVHTSDISISTSGTATINAEIRLGPVPAGLTLPASSFALFGRYGSLGSPTYKPLYVGQFRVVRVVPEGDYLLFRASSIIITEV